MSHNRRYQYGRNDGRQGGGGWRGGWRGGWGQSQAGGNRAPAGGNGSRNEDHHQRHSPYAPTHQPAAQGSFGNGGFGAQSREEGDRRMREATARREEQARREAERARHAQRVQNYQDNSAASILRTTCDSDDDYDGDFGGAMVRLPAPTPPRPHPPLPQVESQACPQRGLASANDQPSASTLSDLSILGGGNPQAPAKQVPSPAQLHRSPSPSTTRRGKKHKKRHKDRDGEDRDKDRDFDGRHRKKHKGHGKEKYPTPVYSSITNCALSNSLTLLQTEVLRRGEWMMPGSKLPWRYFNAIDEKKWREGPVERRFRELSSTEDANLDFIPISVEAMKQDISNVHEHYGVNIGSLDVDDYSRLAKLPTLDATEADLHQKDTILRAQLLLNPSDVKKWLELTRLQRPLFQLKHYDSPDIPAKDLRGLFKATEKVLIDAAKHNNWSIDIKVELLKAEEERFWHEEDAQKRKQRWAKLQNDHPHRISMWRHQIQRWQTGSDAWSLNEIIALINVCLASLHMQLYEDERKMDTETGKKMERFAADILVHRFEAQWRAGLRSDAVKSLQCMAEYWFFGSTSRSRTHKLDALARFWTSGAGRIGEPNTKSDWTKRLGIKRPEVEEIIIKAHEAKRSFHKDFVAERTSTGKAELWRELELASEHVEWNLLHCAIKDEKEKRLQLNSDYKAPPFDWDSAGVLFDFKHDIGLPQQVLLRILGFLGAVVPEMREERDPQAMLRHFSSELFPAPEAENCWRIGDFLLDFLSLLAESTSIDYEVDRPKVKAAILLTWAKFNIHRCSDAINNSEELKDKKFKQLHNMIKELSAGDGSICAVLTYYAADLFHSTYDPFLQLDAMKQVCDALMERFAMKDNGDEKAKEVEEFFPLQLTEEPDTETAYFLKLLQFFLHRLPFIEKRKSTQKDKLSVEIIWTRLELLTRLAINGNLAGPPLIHAGIDRLDLNQLLKRAGERWKELMHVKDARMVKRSLGGAGNDLGWFANPYPILLDMAGMFFHEMTKYYHFNPEKPDEKEKKICIEMGTEGANEARAVPTYPTAYRQIVTKSPLAKLIAAHPLQPVEDIKAIKISAEEFSYPGSTRSSILSELLADAVEIYPRHLGLLKRFIDASSIFSARQFLHANPGLDDRVRLLRSCALIYVEAKALQEAPVLKAAESTVGKALGFENAAEDPSMRVRRYRAALEAAARAEYPHWVDTSDYLWGLWMREEQKMFAAGTFGIYREQIESILHAGLKRFPYSKSLLLEAAQHCRSETSSNALMQTVTDASDAGKVRLLTTVSEVTALEMINTH